MHDEFRLQVTTHSQHELIDALGGLQGDQHRLAVTHEGDHVFMYADSLQAADQARQRIELVISQQGLQADVSLSRWHPVEERWEDASLPLPSTESQIASEHAILEQAETERSTQTDYPEWEVRITLPTHHDARSFAERLRGERIPVTQRWRHLLVGANDEDDAKALVERLRVEAPAGSELEAQGSGLQMWNMLQAPAKMFTFFGGMAQ
jgi:hypothetical protein